MGRPDDERAQPGTMQEDELARSSRRHAKPLTEPPEPNDAKANEKPALGDAQNQPSPDEFRERGMGVAAKE